LEIAKADMEAVNRCLLDQYLLGLIQKPEGVMGPYYRGTSQGIGGFFDLFYQYPILMLVFVSGVIGAAIFFIWKKRI
jgi:hypothetical protein